MYEFWGGAVRGVVESAEEKRLSQSMRQSRRGTSGEEQRRFKQVQAKHLTVGHQPGNFEWSVTRSERDWGRLPTPTPYDASTCEHREVPERQRPRFGFKY